MTAPTEARWECQLAVIVDLTCDGPMPTVSLRAARLPLPLLAATTGSRAEIGAVAAMYMDGPHFTATGTLDLAALAAAAPAVASELSAGRRIGLEVGVSPTKPSMRAEDGDAISVWTLDWVAVGRSPALPNAGLWLVPFPERRPT
jgi:hypothetical protein